MGQAGVLNEGLIGRIEQDESVVAAGVVHPGFELVAGGNGSGGVVGEAEIDQIHRFAGDLRGEAVVGADRQIAQTGVAAKVAGITGAARHHVAVHIHRIDRVRHRHAVAFPEDVEDVAAVALGAVGDENLIGADVASPRLEILLGNRLAQPGIALLRAITMESFGRPHLIDGALHRLTAGQGQRFGDITDSESDQGGVGVGGTEGLDATSDFREQVARLELEVIAVDLHHGTGGVSAQASCRAASSIRCLQE